MLNKYLFPLLDKYCFPVNTYLPCCPGLSKVTVVSQQIPFDRDLSRTSSLEEGECRCSGSFGEIDLLPGGLFVRPEMSPRGLLLPLPVGDGVGVEGGGGTSVLLGAPGSHLFRGDHL